MSYEFSGTRDRDGKSQDRLPSLCGEPFNDIFPISHQPFEPWVEHCAPIDVSDHLLKDEAVHIWSSPKLGCAFDETWFLEGLLQSGQDHFRSNALELDEVKWHYFAGHESPPAGEIELQACLPVEVSWLGSGPSASRAIRLY